MSTFSATRTSYTKTTLTSILMPSTSFPTSVGTTGTTGMDVTTTTNRDTTISTTNFQNVFNTSNSSTTLTSLSMSTSWPSFNTTNGFVETTPSSAFIHYRWHSLPQSLVDILIGVFLSTFVCGLVLNTLLVVALMRRKRQSTPADLVVSNIHFCLYYLLLDSLVLFNELFLSPKPSFDFQVFYVSNPFTNCAMPYLFAVFHMGVFGCLTVLSAIIFVNVVYAPMSRISSMRNVALAVSVFSKT